MKQLVDILMITYNRPEYTRLSLARLLETCDDSVRVWLWHNGGHDETLSIVREFALHLRVHRFHHSPTNEKLEAPTNWLWKNSDGAFVGKVDDDCVVPENWVAKLVEFHSELPKAGVVGCCHFHPGDLSLERAGEKCVWLMKDQGILRNCWIGGSGYLMKRACVEEQGAMRKGEGWSRYCIRLARSGWTNGWLLPLLYQEHMDDPRSPHTMLRSDEDLVRLMPLSAQRNGVTSLKVWQEQLKRSAEIAADASLDPSEFIGYRRRLRDIARRLAQVAKTPG